MSLRKTGEQEQSQHGVAKHGHQNGDQAHQLKPVSRGHFLAASAHRLFRQEIQSTAIAIHRRSPVGRKFELTRQCMATGLAKLLAPGPVLVVLCLIAQSLTSKEGMQGEDGRGLLLKCISFYFSWIRSARAAGPARGEPTPVARPGFAALLPQSASSFRWPHRQPACEPGKVRFGEELSSLPR